MAPRAKKQDQTRAQTEMFCETNINHDLVCRIANLFHAKVASWKGKKLDAHSLVFLPAKLLQKLRNCGTKVFLS